MLDHQGRKTLVYDEIAQMFGELTHLASVIDATKFVATGAILNSDDIGWAWNYAVSINLRAVLDKYDISAQGRLLKWYAPLYKAKISVDILDPLRDLSAYKVVFAPNLYLITPEIVEKLKCYVRNGGLLIVGPKAALKNWDNVFYDDLPPCQGMSEVLGTAVKISPFRRSTSIKPIVMSKESPFAGGMRFANEGMSDNLEPVQSQTIAWHEGGEVAVTLNHYGAGLAMHMGCEPEETFYCSIIEWLVSIGKLTPILKTDADVEITMREGGGHKLIFVLNHNTEPAQIVLEKGYRELITDQAVSGVLVVEGRGVRILSEKAG